MEDILKKRYAANTDKVIGNSVNYIIRKYLNEKNLPVDFESLDYKHQMNFSQKFVLLMENFTKDQA